MKRYCFLAAAAFFVCGKWVSGWFYIPAWICIIGGVVLWHDEQKAPGKKMSPAVEALYATGIPALFTSPAWGSAIIRLWEEPSLRNLKRLALNPAVILVVVFYLLALRAFKKPDNGTSPMPRNDPHVD